MPVYFYVSPDDGTACRESVMAFTHGDRYKPLPGYKTMVTHFHTAFTQELMDSGSLDTTPPWIPMMRAMGINIAHIFDFHGDGHPHDPGPLRLKELETYFEALPPPLRRRLPDPARRGGQRLPGRTLQHPVPEARLLDACPRQGPAARRGSPEVRQGLSHRECRRRVRGDEAGGRPGLDDPPSHQGLDRLPRQDHETPTTSGATTGWAAAFKAMPVDLSQKRLGEVRCFGTLDDMNNWGGPKYMVGEVDTYKKFPDYDLYGDFNVNYVKLDRVPSFDDWSPICRALRSGEFFVTTGEVLIPNWGVEGSGKERTVVADVEWTFPLEFVEAVWGDGEHVGRTVISATDQPPFGSHRFRIPFDAAGKKWVRFSVWDSAGNGAFTQPVHLK